MWAFGFLHAKAFPSPERKPPDFDALTLYVLFPTSSICKLQMAPTCKVEASYRVQIGKGRGPRSNSN